MAAAKVVFHPGASEDYAAAFAWYYPRGITIASSPSPEFGSQTRLYFCASALNSASATVLAKALHRIFTSVP